MIHQEVRSPGCRRGERGYALLFALFLVASMILIAAVAAPRVLTEGRREKEAELIWRGKQYTRAIRLYYQKNGKYPPSLEDLEKPDQVGNHYLRKAYKEPMNADGAWRLIYVSPSGQLVGSVNYYSLQDMAAKLGLGLSAGSTGNPLGTQPGTDPNSAAQGAAAAQQGAAFGQQGSGGFAPGQPVQGGQAGQVPPGQQSSPNGQDSSQNSSQSAQGFGQQGFGQQGFGQQGAAGQQIGFGSPQGTQSGFGQGFGQPAAGGQLQAVDGPVFGGSVIGVASKVKKDSIAIYQGTDSYAKWEFIFNPLVSGGLPGQATPGTAAPGTALGLPGSSAATPNRAPWILRNSRWHGNRHGCQSRIRPNASTSHANPSLATILHP